MILTPADLSVAISNALADLSEQHRDILIQHFHFVKIGKCEISDRYSLRRHKTLGEQITDAYDDVPAEAPKAMREALVLRGLTALHELPVAEEQGKTLEGRLQRKNPNLCIPKPRKKVTGEMAAVPELAIGVR